MKYIAEEEFQKIQKELQTRINKKIEQIDNEEIKKEAQKISKTKEDFEINTVLLLFQKINNFPETKELKEFTKNNIIENKLTKEEYEEMSNSTLSNIVKTNKFKDTINKMFSSFESNSTGEDSFKQTKKTVLLTNHLLEKENVDLKEISLYYKEEKIIAAKITANNKEFSKNIEISYDDDKIYIETFDKNNVLIYEDYEYISDKIKELGLEENINEK